MTFPRRILFVAALPLALGACAQRGDLTDPAFGGFFNGIENVVDGTYDERIATREERVEALRARQQRLLAERNALSRRIGEHRNALAQLKHDLVVAKVRIGEANLDPATRAQVNTAIAAEPTGNTDAERLAALQKTIADTRILAERLANLAG
ncbi:MAG: hypothetical protein AAF631_00270 [Pseudomonadota bacterium]